MKRISFFLKMTVTVQIIIICVMVLYYNYVAQGETVDTCKLVHVVFRHGDRTPTETYNNDPYKNFNWPDGWGALTKKGKSQLYELGSTLHDRYKKIFTEDATTSIVYAQSSYAGRCYMSGATFLAGLYPPTKNQVWNENLNWQPIPIYSLPRNLDNLIAMKKKCPAYDKALADAYNSKEIQSINNENKQLYKDLTKFTGQDMYNITAVEFLFNTLEIEENNGLKLPDWTKSVYPAKLKNLAIRSLEIFTETDFMKRMKGGVMLKEILQNVKLKQDNKLKPDRKMFIYSAHDITLVNVLRTLGLSNNLKPDYGAAFIIEAHLKQSENMEIKMLYYNNSSLKEPYELKLSNCENPCYLNDFIQAMQHMIPDNWEEECKN